MLTHSFLKVSEKPGTPTEEQDDMKEYDNFLLLEESILKSMGLTP